jgi:biopolymer transport protein ExbB
MQDASLDVFGFIHLWQSGDAVSHAVAMLLAAMSIACWYLILTKLIDVWRLRRSARRIGAFWAASSLEEGIAGLRRKNEVSPYAELASQAIDCNTRCNEAGGQLVAHFNPAEQMERTLRQQLQVTQAVMENGLTLLATTGATAPFVGLFGTVWGIYHALGAIGISGQAALEKVAGPVGEALIMTAAGLAVALPAVFAYNAFTRANRLIMTGLDAFAHDLHTFFTMGKPLAAAGALVHPLQPVRHEKTVEVA